jgi:hypothetical protein
MPTLPAWVSTKRFDVPTWRLAPNVIPPATFSASSDVFVRVMMFDVVLDTLRIWSSPWVWVNSRLFTNRFPVVSMPWAPMFTNSVVFPIEPNTMFDEDPSVKFTPD